MDIGVEKGAGGTGPKPETKPEPKPEPEPEVLVMDEPRKPNTRFYILSGAVFVTMALLIGANLGFLSEVVKEDTEKPDISPLMTRSDGYGQKVKFTVDDDRNLPIKVKIRVHFWSTNDSSINKAKWRIDLSEETEASPGTMLIRTLPYLPHKADGWAESLDVGWYVWVDATDYSGKTTSTERCVFPTQWDPDY